MKLFSILGLILLISGNVFCQNQKLLDSIGKLPRPGLNAQELEVACEGYKKMFASESNQIYLKKSEEFNAMINHLQFDWDIKDRTVFDNWLAKNIDKTQFRSLEEAKAFQKELYDASIKVITENKELNLLIARATPQQLSRILTPTRDYYENK
jgi:hypothetical protein